jgi:hypothetical protein
MPNSDNNISKRHKTLLEAREFMDSMRGQYIIGQALCLAIDSLNAVEPADLREASNISDMEYLRDNLFPIFEACRKCNAAIEATNTH